MTNFSLNILVIGTGSIGRRHLNNIFNAGYKNLTVIRRSGLPEESDVPGLKIYATLEDALSASSFDAAFICTPTSLHSQALLMLLQQQIKLIYVEKPLGNSLEQIDKILSLASSYTNKIVVGYDLHFDLGMEKVKELIWKNVTGKILSVNAFAGQYLPQWRPYEDHRSGMSAKKESGGGVLLDLIHEIEYLYRLLGNVDTIACNLSNSGQLEIETEETAELLLKFKSGTTGTLHLDYWQRKLIRYAIFTGTSGTITWNLADKSVIWIDKDQNENKFSYHDFERNERFKSIVTAFLEEKHDTRFSTLDDGIKSLEIVLAAKHSAENNCTIKLEAFRASSLL